MAAHDSRQAQIAEAAVTESESSLEKGGTTILSGKKTTAGAAAFANGVLFQSRGQSDAYGTMAHFGPAVIPAVLALAEQEDFSGAEIFYPPWSRAMKSRGLWRKIISGPRSSGDGAGVRLTMSWPPRRRPRGFYDWTASGQRML